MKHRTKAILTALIVAALLTMAWAWGPWETRGTVCEYCGCTRRVEWRWGIKLGDKITPGPVTPWVLQHDPAHTLHMWAVGSSEKYSVDIRLPGRVLFSWGESDDGYSAPLAVLGWIWENRQTLGEQKALTLLDRYHALLASGDRTRFRAVWDVTARGKQSVEDLLSPAEH